MHKLWEEIIRLHTANAKHNKRGFRLQEVVNPIMPLKHCAEELIEIAESGELEEGCDALICLCQYFIMRGWTIEDIENTALKKLNKTFTV